ncbi:heparinase II/III family protein [Agromyces bracchium]|nr:heparinase II/III-family protein [Agromyces bracchium]
MFHWSPIALSSRILNLATSLAIASEVDGDQDDEAAAVISRHIWLCDQILQRTVERYLGYNHAAFGEVALFVAALLFSDQSRAKRQLSRALHVLDAGTLADGMWSERSTTYHVHMLLLCRALRASGVAEGSHAAVLDDLSARMEEALLCIVHPDGEIATFNDAAIDDAVKPSAVGWTPVDGEQTRLLAEAGYARLAGGNWSVLMDAGPMGPNAVIGHGHADFLSVEVCLSGRRLVVDPGVASISAGPARAWTRSAGSHNGPTFVGLEPAEFFGTWRVGRRGRATFSDFLNGGGAKVLASGDCDGYEPWNATVKRTVSIEGGHMAIEDCWEGGVALEPRSSFIIAAEWEVEILDSGLLRLTCSDELEALVELEHGRIVSVNPGQYFPSGPMSPKMGTICSIEPDGDGVARTRWTWSPSDLVSLS